MEVTYGYRIYQSGFYGHFNTTDQFSLQKPAQTIGVIWCGTWRTGKRNAEACIYYHQIIPSTITIQDSLSAKTSGYVAGLTGNFDLFKQSRTFDLIIAPGFSFGRNRIYGADNLKLKNYFFCPKLSLQPRVLIRKITASVALEYEYDITNPHWKSTWFSGKKGKAELQKFRQSCIVLNVGIGYRF
jgi:hypothetical protein